MVKKNRIISELDVFLCELFQILLQSQHHIFFERYYLFPLKLIRYRNVGRFVQWISILWNYLVITWNIVKCHLPPLSNFVQFFGKKRQAFIVLIVVLVVPSVSRYFIVRLCNSYRFMTEIGSRLHSSAHYRRHLQ